MEHPRVLAAGADPVAAVRDLALRATPACGQTVVVAIDGRSGSGKTVLAAAVARALGAPTLRTDDLSPGWDGLAAAVLNLATWVLDPVARGERAAYPIWDWVANRWGEERVLDPLPFVVVEGCGAGVPPAGEYAAVRVWLEAPESVRKRRALARDGEAYRPYWDRWARQEDALYAAHDPSTWADLVLDGSLSDPAGTAGSG